MAQSGHEGDQVDFGRKRKEERNHALRNHTCDGEVQVSKRTCLSKRTRTHLLEWRAVVLDQADVDEPGEERMAPRSSKKFASSPVVRSVEVTHSPIPSKGGSMA